MYSPIANRSAEGESRRQTLRAARRLRPGSARRRPGRPWMALFPLAICRAKDSASGPRARARSLQPDRPARTRTGAYQAVARGEIPSIRIDRRLVVPVPSLLRMLGVDDS